MHEQTILGVIGSLELGVVLERFDQLLAIGRPSNQRAITVQIVGPSEIRIRRSAATKDVVDV
jgi:hypothetical protein